jgi:hypothetical protein
MRISQKILNKARGKNLAKVFRKARIWEDDRGFLADQKRIKTCPKIPHKWESRPTVFYPITHNHEQKGPPRFE